MFSSSGIPSEEEVTRIADSLTISPEELFKALFLSGLGPVHQSIMALMPDPSFREKYIPLFAEALRSCE